jgi:hypothetical protein
MNLSQIESYAREVQAIARQADELQGQHDQLNGLLRIAEQQRNLEQAKKFSDQRHLVKTAIESVQMVFGERTGVAEAERMREYVVDLFARLRMTHGEYERWREKRAEFELRASLEEGFDRAQEERHLDLSRRRYERALAIAEQMVPNKPVLLIP